jgi:hypothetical protein
MNRTVSQNDPDTMTISEKLAELDGFKDFAVGAVKRMSLLMRSLHKDGHRNIPGSRNAILSFYEAIAGDTLHPEAAALLANGPMIKAVMPLPHTQQIEIANGWEVPVATRTMEGEVKSDGMPIQRMDGPTLKRAFGPEGIRSVYDQAEMIKEAGRVQRHGMFTWDEQSGRVRVGNQTFTWEDADIKAVARRAGYSIVLTRSLGDVEDLAG